MQKNKILIVDDDLSIQELLAVNLRSYKYEVVSAVNGKEAIEKLETEKPDLIILDVMMPQMDGWEVCKIIRDHHELKGAKIIMLTAKTQAKDKMIGMNIFKADKYVTKPFEIRELVATIKGLLSG